MSSPSSSADVVVVTDANIIINLLHVNRIEFLRNLPPYSFVVPEHVIAEICDAQQSAALTIAIANGIVADVKLTDASELSLYADLLRILGSGEAACLTLAEPRGWFLASDEKKVFLREASKRIGRGRILNTAGNLAKSLDFGSWDLQQGIDEWMKSVRRTS